MTEKELEKLYNESYKAVYWTAFNLLKNKEDAEDVIQDTFMTAYKSYDSLRDKSKAVAWVKKIAANKCLNHIKATRTVNVEDEFFEEEEAVGEDFLPESLVESAEKRRVLMDIIKNSLSDHTYITIVLFYFNDMTTKEISKAMGVPQGTVLSRLDYAKKKIKKEVAKYEKENDKLYAMGIPFLTLLFEKEAESVQFKPMPPSFKNFPASHTAAGAVKKAAITAATKGGKIIMIKKIAAAAVAVTLLGGSGVVVYKVTADKKDTKKVRETQETFETVMITNTQASETTVNASYENLADSTSETRTDWICEKCGEQGNTGKFCVNCGEPAPQKYQDDGYVIAAENTAPSTTLMTYETYEDNEMGSTEMKFGSVTPIPCTDQDTGLTLYVNIHGKIYYDFGDTVYDEDNFKAIILTLLAPRLFNAVEYYGYENTESIQTALTLGLEYDLIENCDLENCKVSIESITLTEDSQAEYDALTGDKGN